MWLFEKLRNADMKSAYHERYDIMVMKLLPVIHEFREGERNGYLYQKTDA